MWCLDYNYEEEEYEQYGSGEDEEYHERGSGDDYDYDEEDIGLWLWDKVGKITFHWKDSRLD